MKETEPILRLSKFDVAERQLLLVIRLFFEEEDDVSIHTLSEAAAQILHDIGKAEGVFSMVRDNNRIRPERKKEWLAAIFKSRNFFKHADKDKNEFHEFKPEFNDMSLIDAVNMYSSLKKYWTPETLLFFVWFGLKYPHLIKEDNDLTPVLARLASKGDIPVAESPRKAFFSKAIAAVRSGGLTIPNLTLDFGLPST
jgi:hypothetical protein